MFVKKNTHSTAFILINELFNEHRVFVKQHTGPEYSLKKKVPSGFFILDFGLHSEQEGHLPLSFSARRAPISPCVLSITGVW